MTSLWAGSAANRSRQQPVPAIVAVVVSLMQKPCGAAAVASVPDPGCFCLGGTAYRFTPSSLLVRLSDGVALLSDDVLVSVQTTICLESWLPPVPDLRIGGLVGRVRAQEVLRTAVAQVERARCSATAPARP